MYVEIPIFRRCCFCVPLRIGLQVWGYLRLLITTLLICLIAKEVCDNGVQKSEDIFTLIFTFMVIALNIAFNVMFIIAMYKKNYKLLKVYYYYSVVGAVLSTIVTFISLSMEVSVESRWIAAIPHGGVWDLISILLQFYMILVVRSEIKKFSEDDNRSDSQATQPKSSAL